LHELTEKNDRVALTDPVGKEHEFHDYEVQLNPTLDAVKPHVATFAYHEPTEH